METKLHNNYFYPRFCRRRGTFFKSLLSWLAVEVLSPCRKYKKGYLKQNISPFTNPWMGQTSYFVDTLILW